MGFEEIENLKQKVEKNLDSKLFVPLAEEYRKVGMYEEAINVLMKGLERHPKYTSARVVLGKVYFEKGEIDKAKSEFEKVIEVAPENLFVQKKLAEIYNQIGNKEKAIFHYEKVLYLNPMDKEVEVILKNLKSEIKSNDRLSLEIKEEKTFESENIDNQKKTIFKFIKKEDSNSNIYENDSKKEFHESSEIEMLLAEADEFIRSENYIKAIEMYRKVLNIDPKNRKAKQRLEELKTYIRLFGKNPEELIEKLEKFLQRIKEKRDEFFRNP